MKTKYIILTVIAITLLLTFPQVSRALLIGDLNGNGIYDSNDFSWMQYGDYYNDYGGTNYNAAADYDANGVITYYDWSRWLSDTNKNNLATTTNAVPEPATIILVLTGLGLMGLSGLAIKKRTLWFRK